MERTSNLSRYTLDRGFLSKFRIRRTVARKVGASLSAVINRVFTPNPYPKGDFLPFNTSCVRIIPSTYRSFYDLFLFLSFSFRPFYIFSLKFEGRIFDTRIHRSINILNSRAQIRRYNFLSEHRAGETKTLRGLDVVEKYVNKVIARGNTFGARNMEIRAGSWNLRRHNSIKAAASNSCRTNWRAARPGYLSIHRVESINPGAVAMRLFRNSFRLLPGRMNKRTCAPDQSTNFYTIVVRFLHESDKDRTKK